MKSEKVCTKCKELLPLSDYYYRTSRTCYESACKKCCTYKVRENYHDKQDKYVQAAKDRRIKYKKVCHAYIKEYLLTHPCADCGETDIIVLEFDHIDRNNKKGNIGNLLRREPSLVIAEIEKCVVRCSNCHTRKTAKEFGWWKTLINDK